MEGKICSFPFKLITNTSIQSPLLAQVDFPEHLGVFDKSHTTVDLDKVTKVGVLTQISTNDSVNKIMFYENDCITYVASAYGWSVSEPNLVQAKRLKSNKYYTYTEYPRPNGAQIVGFHFKDGYYGKNQTLVDFYPLYWSM